ncbi:hypothetical protein [Methylobacterium sp. ID0610]|uniref:hypothetical protein n=1 Tax=Methylobacterium carpenticola TaxID=3344827 RepID=UPI0036A6C23D
MGAGRRHLGTGGAALLAVLAAPAAAPAARAQDADQPLMLRIVPRGTPPVEPDGADDGEAMRRAIAAREAFEARITARARRAIASVCTGCLAPEPVAATASLPQP